MGAGALPRECQVRVRGESAALRPGATRGSREPRPCGQSRAHSGPAPSFSSRAPPSQAPPLAAARRAIAPPARPARALRVPLVLPSRSPRGRASDGGAGGLRGGGAGRPERPRQRWVLMTLRPLDLASPGRAPQVRGGTSPLSSPDLGGPPSLARGRCHRSPGVLVWPSGAIVSSPSRERGVLKPETALHVAGRQGREEGRLTGKTALPGSGEPGALQRAFPGGRRERLQGRGSWFHPPGTY